MNPVNEIVIYLKHTYRFTGSNMVSSVFNEPEHDIFDDRPCIPLNQCTHGLPYNRAFFHVFCFFCNNSF